MITIATMIMIGTMITISTERIEPALSRDCSDVGDSGER